MKILFADKFPISEQDKLTSHTLSNQPNLSAEDLPQAITDYEVLVVRSTKVTVKTIDAAKNLKLIIRAGAGTNTIDKPYAAEKGIPVCNTPGKNAVAVAELAMGLMLSIDRHIPSATADLKQNKWNKKSYSIADGIMGKSVGIIGFGAIGQAFAERAKAFGMNLCVYDRNNKLAGSALQEQLGFSTYSDLQELAQKADVVSIHVPMNDATKSMIDDQFINAMQDNAILLNTSRGEVVDERALLNGLNNKNIRAGLDVFCNEPGGSEGQFTSAIAGHDNVVGTHHIGASTQQAQLAVAESVIEIIDQFSKGTILNKVN
ncbi:MAG: NAD(P)-binding domain-containing protein [Gammaproteobacteria bacterium]|nr:NAD(P)-binding domain-containing protein [Gammaproteobacteria bacterium]